MGGKAIKTVPLVRLEKVEYEVLEDRVLSLLKNEYPTADFRIVKSFGDKEDFGDMDILYAFSTSEESNRFHQHFKEMFDAAFGIDTQIHKNGDVTSLAVPIDGKKEDFFQVDLIKSHVDLIDFADFYFSYNDLGNLLGRIAKFVGFKLGHHGLLYSYRPQNDHLLKDITVTTDKDEAMRLLGLDPEKYTPEQMSTLEGVFEFILSSRYFVKEIYLSEHQSHINRKREKKRQTYARFLTFLEGKELPESEFSIDDKEMLREQFLEKAKRFHRFQVELEEAQEDFAKTIEFKERFNGTLITHITGLEGQELGLFMKKLREVLSEKHSLSNKDDLKDYVLSQKQADFTQEILDIYQSN